MPALKFTEWDGTALKPLTVLDAGSRPELRRNVNTNPTFGVDTAGYGRVTGTGGAAVLTREPGPGADGKDGFGRITWTTASTDGGGFNVTTGLAPVSVNPGDQYTLQAMVRANKARTISFGGYYKLGASNTTGAFQTKYAIPANTWTLLTQVYGAAPAVSDNLYLYSYFDGAANAPAVGDWMDLDLVMLEKSSAVSPYFDGATSPADYLGYSWLGPAHASPSIERDMRGGPLSVLIT